MRKNTLVMLGASAAFGTLAVILARGWIQSAVKSEFDVAPVAAFQTTVQATPATQPVLVAAHDIAFGETLTRESFKLADYPEDSVPLDTYDSFTAIFEGADPRSPLRALADIRALEPVFADRISGPGAKGSLSARIREGYIATSLPVDPVTGVGGYVVPGDLVDIMHITQPDTDNRPDFFRTQILLQAVRVLGVDQNAVQSTDAPALARTVTVEVDRRDMQVLALATETGTLTLALRGAGETEFITAANLDSTQIGRARRSSAPRPVRRVRASKPSTDDGRTNVRIVRGETVQSVRVRREDTVQSAEAVLSDGPVLAGGE